jgi:polyphosphate kinase 2 (PPK2 family)
MRRASGKLKQPSAEVLDHDHLWRYCKALPERGRSYEEVLVVRSHQQLLQARKLPPECINKAVFKQRLRDIAHFEDNLTRNGTTVVKFFLNVSREELGRRFVERLERPEN